MSRAVRTEIELAASPEQVWEVVMDPHRLGDWVTTQVGVDEDAPRELGQGDTFEQKLKVSGVGFTVSWLVEDFDKPRSVSWQGSGPGGSSAAVRYELEPAGGGTRFSYENRFELPGGGLGKLAGRAVGNRVARREAERSLENLKKLIDGGSADRARDPA